MDSDEVEAEVNLTRSALKFDFRTGKRDGINNRLLVFQATKATKKDDKKDDKKKDDKKKDEKKEKKDPTVLQIEEKPNKDGAVITMGRGSADVP